MHCGLERLQAIIKASTLPMDLQFARGLELQIPLFLGTPRTAARNAFAAVSAAAGLAVAPLLAEKKETPASTIYDVYGNYNASATSTTRDGFRVVRSADYYLDTICTQDPNPKKYGTCE